MEFYRCEMLWNSKFCEHEILQNVVYAQRVLSAHWKWLDLSVKVGVKETLRALDLHFLILTYPALLPIPIQLPISSSISPKHWHMLSACWACTTFHSISCPWNLEFRDISCPSNSTFQYTIFHYHETWSFVYINLVRNFEFPHQILLSCNTRFDIQYMEYVY